MRSLFVAIFIACAAAEMCGGKCELIKRDAECFSDDHQLQPRPGVYLFTNLTSCANACQNDGNCTFFIFGKGSKAGRCFVEHTRDATCAEGWEADEYDFYQRKVPGKVGCTNHLATNYDPLAAVDSTPSVCTAPEGIACAHPPGQVMPSDGNCIKCYPGTCTGPNTDDGYRNPQFDTVVATLVSPGAITIDGNLRDWAGHDPSKIYEQVAFADTSGSEVVFEQPFPSGGKWYGPADFSIKWMTSWDEDYFYLAADVTDDTLTPGGACGGDVYKNGLQVAFEVGGEGSVKPGVLQAARSADLKVSRLKLLNLGLTAGQSACSSEAALSGMCCISYEKNQNGATWVHKTKAAILRNENAKLTSYEIAFSKEDLLGISEGSGADVLPNWHLGLQFGFSFLINDGDELAEQQGWAGYYPHAIVGGWNNGEKRPQNTGVVVLGYPDPAIIVGGDGGGCGGWIWFGIFLGIGLTVGGLWCRGRQVQGGFDGLLPFKSTATPRFGGGGGGGGGGLGSGGLPSDAYTNFTTSGANPLSGPLAGRA